MNLAHDRVNNFDAMRLFGAVLVLVGHAYPLHGLTHYPSMWGSPVAVLGIAVFFSLSGYLISTSWYNNRSLLKYLRKRALRIFPALAVVVLLSVLILGPIASSLPVGQYFTSPGTWSYLGNIALYPVYALPGVFDSLPYAGVVNGSLWSLPIEFACYLLVPLVALVPERARTWTFLVLAALFGVVSQVLSTMDASVVLYGSSLAQATAVWPYFMVGAAIASARQRFTTRLDFAVVAVLLTSLLDSVHPDIADYAWWFVLPYTVIALGSLVTPVVSRAGRFGDLSYGIYLYAFPVQQVLVLVAPRLSLLGSVALTAIGSACAAFLSWHLIEKRALKWKTSHRETSASSRVPSA